MKKIKLINKICVVFILIIAVVIGTITTCYFGNIKIEKYSFTETQMYALSLDETEKNNINKILSTMYVENQYYAGFSGYSSSSVDLYQANFIVNLAKLLPNYNFDEIREKLKFISQISVTNLDILNLVYYCELCENLDYDIDYFEINDQLQKNYDKETNLFFVDDVNDAISTKLIVTSMIKKTLKDNISENSFNLEKGVKEAYLNYSYITSDNETLYNSGGDILWTLSVFGLDKIVDTESLVDWFNYWKNKYESMTIDSYMSALQYAEYLNVVKVFDPNCSEKKLQDFYDNLTIEKLNEIDDIQVIYNICKNVKLDNVKINSAIESIVGNVINSDNFVNANIDIKSTVFGVILAQKTGYSVNEKKIKNYISENYKAVDLIENTYERTSTLYYNIILDQIMNGYERDYDTKYIQGQVDNILEDIGYEEDLAADCVSTRRLVEIISDLQVFDIDVKLSKKQIQKIKKGMKSALKDNVINESVLINDIFITNDILSLGIISNDEFIKCYNVLEIDGGNISANVDNIIPDLLSTYQFMISLNRMDNFKYLDQQKSFIESLGKEAGIYVLDKNNIDSNDLSVIVYGNAAKQFEIGGDKND